MMRIQQVFRNSTFAVFVQIHLPLGYDSYDSYQDHYFRSKRSKWSWRKYNKVSRMEGEYVHMLGVSPIPHDVSEMLIICSFLWRKSLEKKNFTESTVSGPGRGPQYAGILRCNPLQCYNGKAEYCRIITGSRVIRLKLYESWINRFI